MTYLTLQAIDMNTAYTYASALSFWIWQFVGFVNLVSCILTAMASRWAGIFDTVIPQVYLCKPLVYGCKLTVQLTKHLCNRKHVDLYPFGACIDVRFFSHSSHESEKGKVRIKIYYSVSGAEFHLASLSSWLFDDLVMMQLCYLQIPVFRDWCKSHNESAEDYWVGGRLGIYG